MTNVSIFVTEYLKANMLLPGQIENTIFIMDMAEFSVNQLPKKEVAAVVKMLQDHYPGSMAKFYVLSSSGVVALFYKFLKVFMDKEVTDKIKLTSDAVDPEMKILFHPS